MSQLNWNDITSAPEWSNLPPDQRAQVRDKFYSDQIAPNVPSGIDPADVQKQWTARTAASLQPAPPSFGMQAARWIGRAGQAAGSRALDLGATLTEGLSPANSIASQITGVPSDADNLRATAQRIAPAPAAANDIGARSADFVGSMVPDTVAAVLSGGTSEAPEALSLGSRLIGGARSMFLPGAENARETYDSSVNAGASPLDAAKRAAVAGGSTLAMGALPASVAGGVIKRVASGAAIGAGTSELERGAMNAVSPDNMQSGFDPVADALGALAGGTFGGVLGHRAPLAHGDDLMTAHDNVAPVSEDPASHDITPAQPVDTSTAAMIDPDNRAIAAHTQRVADLAQQLNLDPDQAQAVTQHLAPTSPRDPVTGFYTAQDLTPTLQAAQAHVEATGEPSRYAELDVRNLGGLNAAIGHTAADGVLRDLAQSTHAELLDAGAQVVPVRRGGDEYGFVIQGGDRDDVQAALDSAQSKAQDIAKAYGVDSIPHPKNGAPGVGLVTAHEPIVPGQDLAEMFRNIDQRIESQKGEQNGNATTDAARVGSTDGSAVTTEPTATRLEQTRAPIGSARDGVPETAEAVPAAGENSEGAAPEDVAPLPAGLAISEPVGGNIRVSGPTNQQYAPLLKSLGARVGGSVKGQHWTLPADKEPALREALAPHAEAEQVQAAGMIPTPNDAIKAADRAIANRTSTGVLHDFLMKVAPMAASGDHEAQAVAKDFANEQRLARYEGAEADKALTKQFDHATLEKMWRAADEHSVALQQGRSTDGIGLNRLSPAERAATEKLQADASSAYEEARQVGIIGGDADPLPSYVPRMLARITDAGAKRFTSRAGAEANGRGGVRTFTANLLGRKHLTADETEAAAKAHDDDAAIVKNIRTLPLATSRLREAIAGRKLINAIQEIGKRTGVDTVVDGGGADSRYFTLDNPAFTKWVPRLKRDDATGKMVAVNDSEGHPIFDKTQLRVLGTFEGPLRAVMSDKQGALYRSLMSLKAKTMGVIMYSPLIHNAVEFGRSLPAMPGKVATFRIYFDGNKAKNDPATMREAINAGLSPIGGHGAFNDIESIADSAHIQPGRSWTAKLLAYVPGLFDKDAGAAVKRAVDKMGSVWHQTLLWDRVADLQMGLYTGLRDQMLAKGMQPRAAQIVAAHMANRYAGSLPKEAMSSAAQKIANLTLFSRTFTLGNLGAMKDALTGLPKDAQAQILRDAGAATLHGALKFAKRKALATVMLDIGLMYVTNSLLQSSIAIMRGDSTIDKEAQGYLQRLSAEMQKVKENPLELLHAPAAISATSQNEPGKQDRVLVGHAADGTAIYMRNPIGKIGEEFQGWLTGPLDMLKKKLSTFAQPTFQTLSNDKGFGQKVYDDTDDTTGATARRLGRIAMLYIGAQLPMQAVQGAADYFSGKGDATLNAARVLSPLAGVTFSKGAPGGEAVGELYDARAHHDFAVQDALPGIRDKIRAGNTQGAVRDMTSLGIPIKLQEYYVKTTLNPAMRLSPKQLQEFGQYASTDERARMQSDLQSRAPQ